MTEQQQSNIFETWLKDHKALFIKVVRAYAFTPDDQDDLFQEIAVQVWRSVPKFRHEAAVTTWIYRIALNTAMKWAHQERKHNNNGQPYEKIEHLLQENFHEDERLAWLYEQIASFNKIDRSLTLLLLDGYSYKDMAEILGITESHIGVKIHRIKQHLITRSKEI